MAFDRENFFKSCGHYGRGSAIADGFEALHAELAELKAACLGLKDRIAGIEGRVCGRPEDTPDAPARETGWAVVNHLGDPFTENCGFMSVECAASHGVLWFGSKEDAAVLQSAVETVGRSKDTDVALLYKDTLEEVDA